MRRVIFQATYRLALVLTFWAETDTTDRYAFCRGHAAAFGVAAWTRACSALASKKSLSAPWTVSLMVKARSIIPCAFKPAAWSERLADVVVKSPNRMAAGARAAVRRRRVLMDRRLAMPHRAERPAQALAAKP